MKIFFPTNSFSAFNPGLAFRICATVTLMFFSRYACTIASSVSPDLITYSKTLCPAWLIRGDRVSLCAATGSSSMNQRRLQHLAQLQQFGVDLLGVVHPFAVHFLDLFRKLIQVFRAGVAGIGFGRLLAHAVQLLGQLVHPLFQRVPAGLHVVNSRAQLVQSFFGRRVLGAQSRRGAQRQDH